MSNVKYTKDQEKAIYEKNKNIIVSAQAGAGKTQVLVGRIINLIEKKNIDIENLLIVTFTNKAAEEMKSRIKKKLQEKINSTNGDEKKLYQKQYNKTINAQISTMHAFCVTLLRVYFYKLGISPDFKLLRDSSYDLLKWKTITDIFDEFYQKEDERFFDLIRDYSKKYSDEYVKEILLEIYNFIQSQVNPFGWLREKIDMYNNQEDFNNQVNKDKLDEKIKKTYIKKIEELKEYAFSMIEYIKSLYDDNMGDPYSLSLEKDREYLNTTINSISDCESLVFVSSNFEFSRLNVGNRKIKESKSEEFSEYKKKIKDLIDAYRNPLKTIMKEIKLIDFEEEIESEIRMKSILNIIYIILDNFDKKFKENKYKQNSLDFNDLEHLTIRLLEDEEVVEEIKNKYKYIFFDEYQDSNQVQNYIVEKIKSDTNLFFVGDIKQSIYKFRLADPTIFKDRYDTYSKNKDKNIAIDLVNNFRSEKNILNFNNFIFNSIMSEKIGDVNYNSKSHRFNPGKNEYTGDSIVETNYICTDLNKYAESIYPDNTTKQFSEETLQINVEAILVAKKINEIIKKGYNYKDIAVFSRGTKDIIEIQKYLDMMDIPNYSDSKEFSYEDIELKIFIQILKAIDNDKDDIVLLSAITSTLAGFTDEEIARIRGDISNESFYKRFYDYKNRDDLSDEIIYKIENYIEKIENYRKRLPHESISNFIWKILVDSGHMSYVLSKEDGDKTLENINILIEEIKELENNNFQTFSSFINYIDRILEKRLSKREPKADLSEEDDVVRLMTIHKSKGLEFKNVILTNLNKKFNKKDLHSIISLNDKAGIAISLYDKKNDEYKMSINQIAINHLKEKEQLSEEMRILYVALSRAESNLFLISSDKEESISPSMKSLSNMSSYHDWIYSVINSNEMPDEINYRHNQYHIKDLYKEIEKNENSQELDSSKFNFIKDQKIERVLSYEYVDKKTDIPFKKSVSQISAKEKNLSFDFKDFEHIYPENQKQIELRVPRFAKSESEYLDPLTKGSLYHFIFEKIDSNISTYEEIRKYLIELQERDFISKVEYESIDIEMIKQYIDSDLYRRILNSNNVYREKSFTMYIEENGNKILVDGQIDLYFIENNDIVLVDFKTNKKINDNLYKKQLELYKIGLEEATGKKVKEKILYWIMHGKYTSIK